jgi:hypothetical protein
MSKPTYGKQRTVSGAYSPNNVKPAQLPAYGRSPAAGSATNKPVHAGRGRQVTGPYTSTPGRYPFVTAQEDSRMRNAGKGSVAGIVAKAGDDNSGFACYLPKTGKRPQVVPGRRGAVGAAKRADYNGDYDAD